MDLRNNTRGLRVLVVGGGFAGIGAAKQLACHPGVNVTVLEASANVGGRAKQAQLPSGTSVELGATWFHGVHDNPVYDLAVWLGVVKDVRGDLEVQKHENDWQLHFARPLEQQLLQGELNNIAMEAVGRYTEVAEECTQGAQISDGSVGDVLRRVYDETVQSERLTGASLQTFAEAWYFREQLQRTFDGFYSTDDVGLAFAREYETLEGPNLPVAGGYQALLERLAQGVDVRCGHLVTRIAYGPDGAVVTCSNGAVIEADAVLVTVSLGVLQAQHTTLFDPPLPNWKVGAMDGVRIGIADKMFVEFEIDPAHAADAALWLTSHTGGGAISHARTSTAEYAPSGHYSSSGTHPVPQPPHHNVHRTPSPPHPTSTSQPLFSIHLPPPLSPPRLPPSVARALPPPAAGGQPEPFNIGRKASTHDAAHRPAPSNSSMAGATTTGCMQSHPHPHHHNQSYMLPPPHPHPHRPARPGSEEDSGTSAATTKQAPAAPSSQSMGHLTVPPLPLAAYSSSTGGRRRRKHRRTIHSYAFLWPLEDPAALGLRGARQGGAGPPLTPVHMPDPLAAMGMPHWCLGLHSVRYCPGPEWIQPVVMTSRRASTCSEATALCAAGAAAGALGKRPASEAERPAPMPAVPPPGVGATHVSGVLWITGNAAVAMEEASDEEVAAGVAALFAAFPQVPIPPGAKMPPKVVRSKWGTDPLMRGSYSYTCVGDEGGNAVDMLAEPLCNDEGVPVVLFAGEATHRQYIGTVHGAFLSGCREAERLLMAWGEAHGSTAVNSLVGDYAMVPATHTQYMVNPCAAARAPAGFAPQCSAEHAVLHQEGSWDMALM